ncbi:MAG TPA: S8 family serine peptidase [Ktedonobacterales bacterium]
MADQPQVPAPGSPEPGRADPNKQPMAIPPAVPFAGGWSAPPPDTFREFSTTSNWAPQQPAIQPPLSYPAPAPNGNVQGNGYWPTVGAPPAQGNQVGQPPAGWRVSGQLPPLQQPGFPTGFPPGQQPPPPKTTPTLIALFGGLALLIILVPVILLLTSHSPTPVTVQNTPTVQSSPTVGPTATPPATFFKPAGTAPTTSDCEKGFAGGPCYSPEQMQRAFGLEALYQQGITGAGQTIVLLEAGHTDTVQQDLLAFDKAWGLPDPPSFKILQPFGPPVAYNCGGGGDGLEEETTLDVEWAHAMAPGASIVIVVGANNERKIAPPPHETKCGLYYLEDDLAYVLDNHLGNIVSISFGGSELSAPNERPDEKANDQKELTNANAIFQRAAQEGVTVLASSGDDGATNPGMDINDPTITWNIATVSWPASNPYVVGVGGTTLQLKDASGTYGSETVWNNPGSNGSGGGGISTLYAEPDYQKSAPDQSIFNGKRGVPDLAFPADVNYSLYFSGTPGDVNPAKWPHWGIIGGTSASSPCMAGILALAAQMRGKPLGDIHAALYSLQGQGMHDITQGDNSFAGVKGYQALPGFDLVTGWGTPIADQFVPALVQALG